jgi:hypothetical protein
MPQAEATRKRCAIYTRKSSEEGLEQEFNSLQAQHEACEAYIRASSTSAGHGRDPATMMAGSRAAIWVAPRCNSCSPISEPAASISWSSTRSTADPIAR